MMVNLIKQLICNKEYRTNFLIRKGFFDKMPDVKFIKKVYRIKLKKELDLDNPKSFNEKLQWLKLNDRRPEYTIMVDKYLVRDYIGKKLGNQYLIPLLGVWDSAEDIDFSLLPDEFVLKCNHNSGLGMCICKDKKSLNIKKVKEGLTKGLAQDYYLEGREWPYKNVQRKIVCEKFMKDNTGELADYKIHNFNGDPKVILVCTNRFKESGLREDFYSNTWEHLAVQRPGYPNAENPLKRPAELDKMLELAKILAKDIPFVRTDFYVVNGDIYFGELTFYPASGFSAFEPERFDELFGDWIDIPVH